MPPFAARADRPIDCIHPKRSRESMSKMRNDLQEELSKLSVAERLELVQDLWDGIAAECEQVPHPLTDRQREELERRIRELEEHPERAVPWGRARMALLARRSRE